MVLDEATAHLVSRVRGGRADAPSARLSSGRTSPVIAHRLSTVREADELLVIDGGRVD